MKLTDQVRAARRVSTPLIAVNTPDPAAAIASLCDCLNGSSPKLEWDVVRSFSPINTEGRDALGSVDCDAARFNPVAAFTEAAKLPPKSVLFIHNAHAWMAHCPKTPRPLASRFTT